MLILYHSYKTHSELWRSPNASPSLSDSSRVAVEVYNTDMEDVEEVIDVEDANFEEWIEATEGLASQIAKINELAYTSSFGEYNPGGGKDQIAKYLELARGEVVLMRDSLKDILTILGV